MRRRTAAWAISKNKKRAADPTNIRKIGRFDYIFQKGFLASETLEPLKFAESLPGMNSSGHFVSEPPLQPDT